MSGIAVESVASEDSVVINEVNVVKTDGKVAKTATKSELDNKDKARLATRQLRNFTYKLNDVENIFTSKISFFLKELNKQLNALTNSSIYKENKEKLNKVLKSKGEFRKELLHLLKTEYKNFYHKYYFEAEIFGNKAKYFRTVIEEYRRILLSRLQRQTVIDMIVKNPSITYQEVFNKLCELNERSSDKAEHYKFNWISKADFNNIIKQLSNSAKIDHISSEAISEATSTSIDVYAIDYSSEDDQISEFSLTESEDKESYIIEFKLKYSDYTTQSDSLLTYQCKVPKKQIKGLTTGYTKLKKFTRPRIFLRGEAAANESAVQLYISFNYELELALSCRETAKLGEDNSQNVESVDCTDLQDRLDSVNTWQFKTMGIDIGVAKSATAAIMTTNMCWTVTERQPANSSECRAKTKESDSEVTSDETAVSSENETKEKIVAIDFTQPVAISNELTISDKTKSVSEHIELLKNEQNHIYKKEKAIYDLLKLKQFDDNVNELVNHAGVGVAAKQDNSEANSTPLFNKYQRLNKHRLHLCNKVSNLKKELSFLTARDMISHAIDNNVDLIALEKLSWISDADIQHTTWDYSQIQQRIIHEANIYGIKVKKVSCAYSSAHNPLTLEKEEVDENRKLVKCLFDRDYAAAIILARRGVKLGKRKLKLSPSCEAASHINDSFKAVSCSIKPSLKYRQLKLCAKQQKSIMHESNFVYYCVL